MTDLPPAKRKKGIEYTGVCVVFFCHDGVGNFVMAKRSLNTRDEQERWDTGGGALEYGAHVEETVRQEVLEEYCARAQSIEFLGYRDVHRTPGGVQTHWIALDFKCLVDPGEVRIGEPDKVTDLQWFTFDTLPPAEELHSNIPLIFEKYRCQL